MDPSTNPGIQPFGVADLEAVKSADAQRGIASPAAPKAWDGPVAGPGLVQNGPQLSAADPYQTRNTAAVATGSRATIIQAVDRNGSIEFYEISATLIRTAG